MFVWLIIWVLECKFATIFDSRQKCVLEQIWILTKKCMTIWGHFGPIWTLFGHFTQNFSFCSKSLLPRSSLCFIGKKSSFVWKDKKGSKQSQNGPKWSKTCYINHLGSFWTLLDHFGTSTSLPRFASFGHCHPSIMCAGGSKMALLGPKMAKRGRLVDVPKWSKRF